MIPPHQRPRSRRNRETWVLRHLPLVRNIAKRVVPAAPQLEVDDLVSAGTIGLIEAVDRYDVKRGVPFTSFAYRRIRGAIIDEVSQLAAVRTSRDDNSRPLSLEAPLVEERNLTLLDVTVDPSAPEPERGAELNELLEAAQSLPRREREMIALSAAGHTVAEIAEQYGCSQSLASQLLSQARFRLEERTAA